MKKFSIASPALQCIVAGCHLESTQQRVTMVAEQANGHILKVRRSTTPEANLANIQQALGMTALPVCPIKSVWLREPPPEKRPPSESGG